MFENLLKLLASVTDETLKGLLTTEINLIKTNYLKISNDLIEFEKENKTFLNEKDHLLNEIEKVRNDKTKNAGDEVFKKELEILESKLKEKNDLFESLKTEKESVILNHNLEIELLKNSASLNAVSGKALEIIYAELKKDAHYENGKIVYKNVDGTAIRKDGISIDLAAKISMLKENEDYQFLFKNDTVSGTGIITNSSSTNSSFNKSKSASVNTLKDRAAKLGIKL